MMKKRGVFVVVVALLLFSLASVIVQAEEFEYANEKVLFYYALFLYNFDDDDECDSANLILQPRSLNDNKNFAATYGYTGTFSSKFDVSQKKGDLTIKAHDCGWNKLSLSSEGCYAIEDEGDSGSKGKNDCGAVTFPKGITIINQDKQYLTPASPSQPPDEGGTPQGTIFNCDYLQTTYDEALLCGEKEFEYVENGVNKKGPRAVWQICNSLTEGKYVKVGGQTFHCALNVAYGYQWLPGFPSCAETECDESKEICEGGDNNFNWLDGASENNCCGDDGVADLDTRTGIESGNYVCLSSNGLVGTPFDITQKGWGTKIYGESPASPPEGTVASDAGSTPVAPVESENSCAGKEWCWITASGDPAFHIYTIKKPGEAAYDIVSNNDKWYSCKEEEKLQKSKFSEDLPNINKFYCYAEGNKWTWAECCGEGTECVDGNANGIKTRKPGDGLFNLPNPDPASNSISFNKDDYTRIYGKNNFPDFTGYDYLEFYFSFTSAEVSTPAKVILEAWSGDGKLFENDVLSYVVNGAKFESNSIMHVKIPISNWSKVDRLNFRSKPSANTITVTQVHLTKAEGDNPICSGETSPETSSWLPDLDYYDPGEISGKKMCEALGMSWLEGNIEEQYHCCGDDGGEYYVPPEGAISGEEKWACWNSAKLLDNQTVTEVRVELTYGQGEWKYNYPEEDVSGMLEITTNKAGEVSGELTFKCRDYTYFFGDGYDYCTGSTCTSDTSKDASDETCDIHIQDSVQDDTFNCGGGYNKLTFPCDDGPYVGDQLLRDVLENQLKPKTEKLTFSGKVSASSPVRLSAGEQTEIIINKGNFVSAKVSSTTGKVYLIDPLFPEDDYTELQLSDLTQDLTTFYVMGESEEIKRDYNYAYKTENLTFSCFGETCKIPIKGNPPYTIKNPHPQEYDLYYVNSVNGKELRVLIDKEKKIYARDGWLEAKKVPRQILFAEGGFWECGDNSTTNNKIGEAELLSQTFCGVKSGYYCDKETGWSNASLPLMKYNELNVLLLSETMESISPSQRNHSSSVVFGRNFLFNPWLGMVK